MTSKAERRAIVVMMRLQANQSPFFLLMLEQA